MWVVGILRHSSKVQKHMYKGLIKILRSWIIRPKFEMIGGVNNDYSWQNISKCHKINERSVSKTNSRICYRPYFRLWTVSLHHHDLEPLMVCIYRDFPEICARKSDSYLRGLELLYRVRSSRAGRSARASLPSWCTPLWRPWGRSKSPHYLAPEGRNRARKTTRLGRKSWNRLWIWPQNPCIRQWWINTP